MASSTPIQVKLTGVEDNTVDLTGPISSSAQLIGALTVWDTDYKWLLIDLGGTIDLIHVPSSPTPTLTQDPTDGHLVFNRNGFGIGGRAGDSYCLAFMVVINEP